MELSKGKRNFLVVLISFMVGIIYFIPYIRFTFYDQTIAAFQLTNMELGNLGAVYGLVALFCYPISGFLAEKFSPKLLLAASFIGTAAMTFWQASFPSYGALLVIYILFAFFTTATLWSPYIAVLRNLGTEEEQGKLFGISEAMRGIVSTVTGFVFVWILSLFADAVGGFRAILIIGAVVYIIFAALAIIFLPKNVSREEKENEGKKEKGSILKALKLPGVWLMGLFIFSCYSIIAAGINYLGTYTTQILGVSASVSSSLAIIRSYVLTVVAGIGAGIIADKFKSRLIFLVYVLIAIIVCAVATPFLSNLVTLAIIVSMVLSLLYFMMKSVYFSIMGESGIPVAMTGIASGIVSFIGFIPDAFITSLMGSWLDKDPVTGFNMIFAWIAIWGVIAIVLALVIYKRGKKNQLIHEK